MPDSPLQGKEEPGPGWQLGEHDGQKLLSLPSAAQPFAAGVPLLTPAPGEACEPSQVIFSSPCCFSSLYLAKEALRPE